MRRATLSFILIFWCVTLGVAQDKGNQWLGTWKLDTAKSKLQQSPKEETLQVDAAAKDNIKWSLNGTAADGRNTWNDAPPPERSSTHASPPCKRAKSATSESPIPVPGWCVLIRVP